MNLWKQMQDKCLDKYKKTLDPTGVFSHNEHKSAIMLGEIINATIPGKTCLDIGCGVLPKPVYMKMASDVTFTGIDPYEGKLREFEFIKGYAEDLPFRDSSFDGVLFSTSLDHLKDPIKGVKEAHRVLKRYGRLFFWGGIKRNNAKYRAWVAAEKPALYDDNHLWAFTQQSIIELFCDFELIGSQRIRSKVNGESIMIFKK